MTIAEIATVGASVVVITGGILHIGRALYYSQVSGKVLEQKVDDNLGTIERDIQEIKKAVQKQ